MPGSTTVRPPRDDALDHDLRRFYALDPGILRDPFPLYARLREHGPAYRFGERVLVTRFADAREVLTATTTLQGLSVRSSRFRTAVESLTEHDRQRITEVFGFYEKRPSGVDGERHARLRRLATRAFTPRVVATMRGRIQEVTDELLAGLRGRDEVEFVEDLAYHLPLIVVCDMLDIPTGDRENLRHWSSDLGRFVGTSWSDAENVHTTHESIFSLRAHLQEVFQRRRTEQTTPLLRALLDAEGDDGDRFTEDELVAMITQFVFAGHETTTNLLANSAVALWRDRRDQWALLCEDPDRIPAAVEELLRFAGPTQYIDKIAADDGRIGDVEVRQWDTVSVLLASANRDATVYTAPDTLDVTRRERPHVSFGIGPHHCLGASLARMEAAVVLTALATRFPDVALVADDVEYQRNHMLRGPVRLPVRLGRERSA